MKLSLEMDNWLAGWLAALVIIFSCSNCWADLIDERFVDAIIQVESSGNPNAVSRCGAIGLMQISRSALEEYNYYVYKGPIFGSTCFNKPDGHVYGCAHEDWKGIKTKEYSMNNLYIPEINMEVGTWYLQRLENHYLKQHFREFTCGKYNTLKRHNWDKDIFFIDDYFKACILAAYNMGPTAFKNINYDINKSPKETKKYVKKVLDALK